MRKFGSFQKLLGKIEQMQTLGYHFELYKQMMKQPQASPASRTLARQMVLWLLMISICLLFGSITALFVRSASNLPLSIPRIFYVNTLILFVSSGALHVSFLRREAPVARVLLKVTLAFGLLFSGRPDVGMDTDCFGAGVQCTNRLFICTHRSSCPAFDSGIDFFAVCLSCCFR